MPVKDVSPYLFFNGDAEAAVRLYEKALGAKVTALMRYDEMPAEHRPTAPELARRIMHAALAIGPRTVMISDTLPGRPTTQGSNVEICLQYDEVAEMTARFEALAASGTVVMALHDAFWGDRFGALIDELGVQWMFIGPPQRA